MQASSVVIPFPKKNHRQVFFVAKDGSLDPEAIAAIEKIQASENYEAEVVLAVEVGCLEYFFRVSLTEPECVREAIETGLGPLGRLELDYSIRANLEEIDSRVAGLDEAEVVEWLNLLGELSNRSAERIQKRQASDFSNNVRPENWLPPIYAMFELEGNEIVSGSWTFFNAEEVQVWHRGLVRWSEKLLPLVKRGSRLQFRKWYLEQPVNTGGQSL